MGTNALFLDSPVKALNVGVVVRTVESGVANRHSFTIEHPRKVPAILWAVVGLNHGDSKTPGCLGLEDGLGSEAGTELWRQDDMRHPGK